MRYRLVNVVLGLWLMVAPAVLGYSSALEDAGAFRADSIDRVFGPLIITFATVAIWPELRPLRWANTALGALLVLAGAALPAWLPYTATATASQIATGAVVLAVATVRGRVDTRSGGGWRSVWRSDVDTVDG